MSEMKNFKKGLGPDIALGASGGYREGAIIETLRLATCHWDGFTFHTGETPDLRKPLFSFILPSEYSTRIYNRSWTGLSVSYEWEGDGVDVELRRTLPGVLMRPRKKSLRLCWQSAVNSLSLRSLEDGKTGYKGGFTDVGRRTLFAMDGRRGPMLLIFSHPPTRLEWINHSMAQIEFAEDGASMMLAPLLDEKDLPRSEAAQKCYRSLLERPPLECTEYYSVEDNAVHIRQDFGDARWAPVPPLFANLGETGGLMKMAQERTRLLSTLVGPYEMVEGPVFEATIATNWMKAEARPRREASGELAPVPEELAYAGDATWEPGTPMDQFLALRTWAPLLEAAPDALRAEIISHLQLPSPERFRESLATITEPTTGRQWCKDAKIFPYWGDVCYDADWYNGLTLSGLDRATRCVDEKIASGAKAFSQDIRSTRDLMVHYYEFFHDWCFCSSFSCPNGTFWNQDCVQNGLEGILAEVRLRDLEGDCEGADYMRYLGAKTAAACLASFPLGQWCNDIGFGRTKVEEAFYGVNGYTEKGGVSLITAGTKNPYCITNHFPEYFVLLRDYGPRELLEKLVRTWEAEHPERYSDWIHFYIRPNHRELLVEEEAQEERIQGAVFYHLSPEICLRLWTLDQEPEEIERCFQPEINLAEQLMLRGDMKIC